MPAASRTKSKKPTVRATKDKKLATSATKVSTAAKKVTAAKVTAAKVTIKKNKKPIKKASVAASKPVHVSSKVALGKVEAGVELATVKVAKLTNDLVELRMKRSAAQRKVASSPKVSFQNALNSTITRVEATRSKLDDAQKILSQGKKQLVVAKARDRLQTRLDGLDTRMRKREVANAANVEKRLEAMTAKFRAKKHAEMEKTAVKKMKAFVRTINKKKAAIEAAFEKSQHKRAKRLLKAAAKITD